MLIPPNGNRYEVFDRVSDIKSKLDSGRFRDLKKSITDPRKFGLGSKEALVVIDDSRMGTSDIQRLASDTRSNKGSIVFLIENLGNISPYQNHFDGFPYIVYKD